MYVWCVCLCENMACVSGCPRRAEESVRSPGAGVTGAVNPMWVLGKGPLEEPEELLTTDLASPE